MLDFIAKHRIVAINKEIEGLKQQLLTDKYERQDIEKKIEDLQKTLDIQCPSGDDIYANAKTILINKMSLNEDLSHNEKGFFKELELAFSAPEFIPVDNPDEVIDYQIALIGQLKKNAFITEPTFNYLMAVRIFDYKSEYINSTECTLKKTFLSICVEVKKKFKEENFKKVENKFANRLLGILIESYSTKDNLFKLAIAFDKNNYKKKLTLEQINYFSLFEIIGPADKQENKRPDISDQDNAEFDLQLPVVPEGLPSDKKISIETSKPNPLAHETIDLKKFQQITAAVLDAIPNSEKKLQIINQPTLAFTDIIHATLELQDSNIDPLPVKNYFEQLFKKNIATFKVALTEHSIKIKPKYIKKLCDLCTLNFSEEKRQQLQTLKININRNIFEVNNNNRTTLYILDIFLRKYENISDLSQLLLGHDPNNVTWNMEDGFSSIHIQQGQQPSASHQNSIFLEPMQLSHRIPFLARRNADEVKKIKELIDLMQDKKAHFDTLTPVSFEKLMQSSLSLATPQSEKDEIGLFNQFRAEKDKVDAEFNNKQHKANLHRRSLTNYERSEYVTHLNKVIKEYNEKINARIPDQRQGKSLKDAFFYKCRLVVIHNLKTKLMKIKSIAPNSNSPFENYNKYLKPIDKLMGIQKKLSLQQEKILQNFSEFISNKYQQLNLTSDEAKNVIASIQQHAICCAPNYSEKLNGELLKNSFFLHDKSKKLCNKYAEVLQKIADSKQCAIEKEARLLNRLDQNISYKKNSMYRKEALSILHDTEQYLQLIDYLQRVSEWFDPEQINLYSNAIEFVNLIARQKKIVEEKQMTEMGISTVSTKQPALASVSQTAVNNAPETNKAMPQTVSTSHLSQKPLNVNFFSPYKADSSDNISNISLVCS